ncbi:MAG: tautomerase family protein [Gammaproteobacteria bacterium]|nr:tautomerase family protein [Gammaproteobacteria bacterium]MBT8094063.1 tautomerase family protein [Gammaproteobacteria bacterium]MBT8105722.1 tautomerase family protein [Gammaproteobacteria bacterium]NNK25736.1 4-oxalocrotonate tautomerase [Woeseiaceae bacterium]NNL63143.1 4-oxalocrotonate tautomerase [Woeseiaceae bacterium]
MMLVTVDVLKNALTPDQKELLVEKITAAMVEIGSENTRPATWVRISEFESGDWAIGGRRLSAHDVIEMTRGNLPPFLKISTGS